MCGIVGYIGNQNAAPILIEGLSRLEYRGYDSAGIAVLGSRGAQVFRKVGRVRDLEASLPRRLAGKVGIGHTRWATHGPATEDNAHPQTSEDGRISVVHNGIIDNAAALRERLDAQGVKFTSETDTEVIAHLVARSEAGTLEGAVLDVLSRVTGTYAIAVLDERHPDRLVVARNGSPLILGVGDREMFVASDLSALVRHTTSVVHLDDGELATVTASGFRTFSRDEENTAKAPTSIDLDLEDVGLGSYRHYMRKEILEQPSSIERMLRGRLDERFGTARLDGLNLGPRELRWFRRVKVLGCGSALLRGPDRRRDDRGTGPHPGRRRARLGVPVPQPDHRAGHAVRRGEPVRGDRRHRVRGAGGQAQGRPDRRAGQRGRARPSPGSATAGSTCTPGPRSRSRRPRR